MTLIGCANAIGDAIPAYNIFQTWPTNDWDLEGYDENVRFNVSETGFNNHEIMVDWIKHFNIHSFQYHSEFKRRGFSFEAWFSCDQFRNGYEVRDSARNVIPESERVYRLLLLNGFLRYYLLELFEYCLSFDILILFLPPYLLRKTQPIDIGVFQYIKAAH